MEVRGSCLNFEPWRWNGRKFDLDDPSFLKVALRGCALGGAVFDSFCDAPLECRFPHVKKSLTTVWTRAALLGWLRGPAGRRSFAPFFHAPSVPS